MGDDDSTGHRRRATTKKVNYSEKEADFELLKRIQQHEKGSTKKSKKKSNSISFGRGTTKSLDNAMSKEYQKILNDKRFWNFIPTLPSALKKHSKFSQLLYLDDAMVDIKKQYLYNKEGSMLRKNETIYMVSEPPGEPYYIGRVVKFEVIPEYKKELEKVKEYGISVFPARYFNLKMNWFYRPRDIQESWTDSDSRLLYASLHEDICPIISFRGKCNVHFKSEIFNDDPEKTYKILAAPNNFYFDQLFDKYTMSYYKIWETNNLHTLFPKSNYLKALSKRFKYVYTEDKYPFQKVLEKYVVPANNNKVQSNNSNDRIIVPEWDMRCIECKLWCQSTKCIKCDECNVPIHLACMDPSRDRKPNKGVIWLCYDCAVHQDHKDNVTHVESDVITEDISFLDDLSGNLLNEGLSYNKENCWFQYLGEGLIDNLQDVLYAELFIPFPFKFSRVGQKYQWAKCLEINSWQKEPYDTSREEDKNDYVKNKKIQPDIQRGTEETIDILWDWDEQKLTDEQLNAYIDRCSHYFPNSLKILPQSVNFLDMITHILKICDYNTEKAFEVCQHSITRESLKEPSFTDDEIKIFEDAVREFGSELHYVCKAVGTQPMSMIVRYYYYWKKTPNGRNIWGNFKGRPKNKHAKNKSIQTEDDKVTEGEKKVETDKTRSTRSRQPRRLALENKKNKSSEDIEMKYIDDSSIETEDTTSLKSLFHCIYCNVDYSPIWYKVTGGSDDVNINLRMQTKTIDKSLPSNKSKDKNDSSASADRLEALCIRCARLWRRYAVRWQNPISVLKLIHGNNNSNIFAAFDVIFDDNSSNPISSVSNFSVGNLLEYELIQDSELILKQRVDLLEDAEKLHKLRRGAISAHSQLVKAIRRPYKKGELSTDTLTLKLQNYINKKITAIEKKKEKQRKATTLLPSKEKVTTKLIKAEVRSKRKIETDNIKTEPPHKIAKITTDLAIGNSAKFKPITDLNKKYEDKISSNNMLELIFSLKNGNSEDKILVDLDFENVQLPNNLQQYLYSLLPAIEVNTKATKKVLKGEIIKPTAPKNLSLAPFNNKNIPLIHRSTDTAGILGHYHNYNPSFIEFKRNPEKVIQKYRGTKTKNNPHLPSTDNSNDSKTCSICYSVRDHDNLIECSNCTLNVHSKCYGLCENDSSATCDSFKPLFWLCDPCSNDLNPIISTSYKCCVCSSKEILSGGQKLYPGYVPQQALKATSNGTWCHVICALFGNSIKFGNEKTLQPIINTTSILNETTHKCDICQSVGGVMSSCLKCRKSVHITCAQWSKQYKFGLQKIVNPEAEDMIVNAPTIHSLINKEKFILKPAVICKSHENDTDLIDFHSIMEGQEATYFEFYVQKYKVLSNVSYIGSRYSEQLNYFQMKPETETNSSNRHLAIGGYLNSGMSHSTSNHVCSKCSTTNSLCWFEDNICHSCHIKENFDIQSEFKVNLLTVPLEDSLDDPTMLQESVKTELLKGIPLVDDSPNDNKFN